MANFILAITYGFHIKIHFCILCCIAIYPFLGNTTSGYFLNQDDGWIVYFFVF